MPHLPDGSAPVAAEDGRRPQFLRTEVAGGAVLVVAAAVALVWANSPAGDGYDALWRTAVDLRIGSVGFSGDLRHLINEGLMALFFLVVGVEIKRELVTGELREWRTAALPAVAAVGGMVMPALLYLAVAGTGGEARGWGIPMATDIAFAVGVVALLGRRVPGSLKLFLLTLAVVDDIGAIVVIAVVYSGGISLPALVVAASLLAVMAGLRTSGVRGIPVYVVLGVGVWLAVYESGVHATIAGALLGLLTPARPVAPAPASPDRASGLSDGPGPDELESRTDLVRSSVPVAERLERLLHPITSFAIVPLFALANAGVVLDSNALDVPGGSRIALGVVVGLVVGKLVGVTGAAWLAVRLRIGTLPAGVGWGQVVGIAATAGIGFTVSLFVAGLAFAAPADQDAARMGVLVASGVASVLGVTLLLVSSSGRGSAGPAGGAAADRGRGGGSRR